MLLNFYVILLQKHKNIKIEDQKEPIRTLALWDLKPHVSNFV